MCSGSMWVNCSIIKHSKTGGNIFGTTTGDRLCWLYKQSQKLDTHAPLIMCSNNCTIHMCVCFCYTNCVFHLLYPHNYVLVFNIDGGNS